MIAGSLSNESEHAVAVMAVRSDTLAFEPFLIEGYERDSAGAGRELAARVATGLRGDEIALLVLPDGLGGNCTEFLDALQDGLPAGLAVAGGSSGDALELERCWQYGTDRVIWGGVAGILIRGRGRLEVGVSHGCAPIGLEHRATQAQGGWLREIDGEPAWQVFRSYLDDDPDQFAVEGIPHLSIGKPILAGTESVDATFIIRSPLALDRESGALFFPGGDIQAGMPFRLMRRDPHNIRTTAAACARRLRDQAGSSSPALVIQFDCAGRGRMLFGSRAAEEVVAPLQRAFDPGTPWIGFHTYGEIARAGGRLRFHNYTVALCALYEEA